MFISWLGISGWLVTVSYVGAIVVGICALGIAWIVDAGSESATTKVVLFVLLTGAVSSSGSGTAVWAAAVLVALATRRARSYGWPLALSGLIYAAWYLLIARNDPSPLTPEVPGVGDILRSPAGMWKLTAQGLAAVFGVGGTIGHVLTVLGVGALAWLVKRSAIRPFDVTMILAGVIMLALGVLVRGSQGLLVAAPNRLYLVAVYMLFGLAAPLLALARGRPAWLGAGLIVLLSFFQLSSLTTEIGNRERYMDDQRLSVETAASLIVEGHPFIAFYAPSPQAQHRFIQTMTYQGLPAVLHPEKLHEVEAVMKLGAIPNANVGGIPLSTGLAVDESGCAEVPGGTSLDFGVHGNGFVVVRGASSSVLNVTRSGDADFEKAVALTTDNHGIAYAGPYGSATMTFQGDWSGTRLICGLRQT